MLIDNRLRVRDLRDGDDHLPCTGTSGTMAVLEAFDEPLLRGNRSRIVMIAGELDALIDTVQGSLEANVVRFGMPAAEGASRAWVPKDSGKLIVIKTFGADLRSVRRRRDKTTRAFAAQFAPGEEVVLGLRSFNGETAEVVLIVERAT